MAHRQFSVPAMNLCNTLLLVLSSFRISLDFISTASNVYFVNELGALPLIVLTDLLALRYRCGFKTDEPKHENIGSNNTVALHYHECIHKMHQSSSYRRSLTQDFQVHFHITANYTANSIFAELTEEIL